MNLDLEPKDIVLIAEAVAERIHVPRQAKWMTRQEAADYLRCSTKALNEWVRLGEIPVYRPNSKPLFSSSDLDEFVLTNRREF